MVAQRWFRILRDGSGGRSSVSPAKSLVGYLRASGLFAGTCGAFFFVSSSSTGVLYKGMNCKLDTTIIAELPNLSPLARRCSAWFRRLTSWFRRLNTVGSLSLALTLWVPTLIHSHSLWPTYSLPLTLTHAHLLIFTHSHSRSLTHAHSLSLTLTHAH